jgi:SNF2 family DNA or RNA helicase
MEDRVYRMGQGKTVFIHDLYVKGSVDAKIVRSLEDGVDLFDNLIEVDLARKPQPMKRERLTEAA